MSTSPRKGVSGRKVQVTTPTAGYTSNQIVIIASGTTGWCGQSLADYDAGDTAILEVGHEVQVTKVTGSGLDFAVGEKVYRDSSSGNVTPTATGNAYVGRATTAAGINDTTVWVQFAPTGG